MKLVKSAIMTFIIIMSLSSCLKNEPSSIVGTKWEWREDHDIYTISFIDESNYTRIEATTDDYNMNEGWRLLGRGTYSYEYPNLSIVWLNDTYTTIVTNEQMELEGRIYLKIE